MPPAMAVQYVNQRRETISMRCSEYISAIAQPCTTIHASDTWPASTSFERPRHEP